MRVLAVKHIFKNKNSKNINKKFSIIFSNDYSIKDALSLYKNFFNKTGNNFAFKK